jgi:hypothetical protein
MATVRVQSVRFREDAMIPGLGLRGGLSNVRVVGGNESPVLHEMTFDGLTLRIAHKDSKEKASCVPAANIAWFEEQ